MIIYLTFLYIIANSCNAQPNNIFGNSENVVTVPTNCLGAQQWVNGACREIVYAVPANLIILPINCPPGQSFVNGQCRDISSRALIEDSNQSLQNVNDLKSGPVENYERSFGNMFRVTDIPKLKCPPGYRPDKLGNCRKILQF